MEEEINNMADRLRKVQERRKELLQGGGRSAIDRQHASGKLTVRERLERLLDPQSFIEFDLWATPRKTGFDIDQKQIPGDAVVTGQGEINGRPLYIYANDFTVIGGSYASVTVQKMASVVQKAIKARLPIIGINDSAGSRIQDALRGGHWCAYFPLFYLHSVASGVIPQISLMMGPCAAGAAYAPALTDFMIFVKNTSYMYVSSPTVVKAATFVDVTDEELGGARIHAKTSGTCDLLADDEDDCLRKTKELFSYLPMNCETKPPTIDTGDNPNRSEQHLLNIVPSDPKQCFDMHDVISHIVDKRFFLELKPDYAKNIVTGLARLNGQVVGIIANNSMYLAGTMDINSSDKESRFIRFCDSFNIPLVFLVDTPGYLPAVEQERGGIVRHGAKVLYAISESTVPKITVYIRKAFGGAIAGMSMSPMGADLTLAWPTAEMGVIGVEGAVDILYRKEIAASDNPEQARMKRMEEYKNLLKDPVIDAASARWFEEIIDPRETRPILIKALRSLGMKKEERPARKHGNMPL